MKHSTKQRKRARRAKWTPFQLAAPMKTGDLVAQGFHPTLVEHADVPIYLNSLYQVAIFANAETGIPGTLVTHLSIKVRDKSARHDWRELQRIKNELCGPECDAIEIYPKESRLVDTANQFHLWVFDEEIELPIGFFGVRLLTESATGRGSQRHWPDDEKPADLQTAEEMETLSADPSKVEELAEQQRYERARDALVHDAAEAVEIFGEDELERFAAEEEKKGGSDEESPTTGGG